MNRCATANLRRKQLKKEGIGELTEPLNMNDGNPEPTDETDYLVTAAVAQAGKPDTDLEIAAPILTEPLKTSSSEQLIKECGWKRGQNRARKDDGRKSLMVDGDG